MGSTVGWILVGVHLPAWLRLRLFKPLFPEKEQFQSSIRTLTQPYYSTLVFDVFIFLLFLLSSKYCLNLFDGHPCLIASKKTHIFGTKRKDNNKK